MHTLLHFISDLYGLLACMFSWIIHNIKTIAEILFSGGLFIFFIERAFAKCRERRLIIKMKRQISFELFQVEYALATSLRDLTRAKRNKEKFSRFNYFIKLYTINSVLSSGLFLKFDSKFIGYIFDLLTRIETMEATNRIMVELPIGRSEYPKYLSNSILKTVYALNSLNKAPIYRQLKKDFLTDRILLEREPGAREDKKDRMSREETVIAWETIIREVLLDKNSQRRRGA